MSNLIKLSLVALGVVSAVLLTSSSLFAQRSIEDVQPTGYCYPAESVCGVSSGGFTAKGIYVTM